MTDTHPLIVRITTGRKPTSDITVSEANNFNTKFWEVLMRFFPDTENPERVRIIWQSADPHSTFVWDMLIEVIGAQPTHISIGGNLKEVARDLMPSSYEVVVDFPSLLSLDPIG